MIQRFIFSLFISGLVFIISCSKKDEVKPIIITASDFSASIDENPTNGQVIGKVQASASDNSALTYTLSSQNVSGAISIDGNTGEIRVALRVEQSKCSGGHDYRCQYWKTNGSRCYCV